MLCLKLETGRFYRALSTLDTHFSLMDKLFPNRPRVEEKEEIFSLSILHSLNLSMTMVISLSRILVCTSYWPYLRCLYVRAESIVRVKAQRTKNPKEDRWGSAQELNEIRKINYSAWFMYCKLVRESPRKIKSPQAMNAFLSMIYKDNCLPQYLGKYKWKANALQIWHSFIQQPLTSYLVQFE